MTGVAYDTLRAEIISLAAERRTLRAAWESERLLHANAASLLSECQASRTAVEADLEQLKREYRCAECSHNVARAEKAEATRHRAPCLRRDRALITRAIGGLDSAWRDALASPSPEQLAAIDAVIAEVDTALATEALRRSLRKSTRPVRGENDSEPSE